MANPPPNPFHGQPGHACPMDHWFEFRLQGIDIAQISDALNALNNEIKTVVITEALAGTAPADRLRGLIKRGELIEDLIKRIDKPLDDEYKMQKSEWAKHQEWNV